MSYTSFTNALTIPQNWEKNKTQREGDSKISTACLDPIVQIMFCSVNQISFWSTLGWNSQGILNYEYKNALIFFLSIFIPFFSPLFPICTQQKHHLFLTGTSVRARKNKRKAGIQQAWGDDNRRKMDSRKPIFRTTPTREKHIPQQLQRGCLPEGKGGSTRRKMVRREQDEQGGCKICQVSKMRSKVNLGESNSQISGMKFCLIIPSSLCISNTKGAV